MLKMLKGHMSLYKNFSSLSLLTDEKYIIFQTSKDRSTDKSLNLLVVRIYTQKIFGPSRIGGVKFFFLFLQQLFSYIQALRGALILRGQLFNLAGQSLTLTLSKTIYQKLLRKCEETRHATIPIRSKYFSVRISMSIDKPTNRRTY